MAQYNRLTNLKRKEVHRPDLEQDYHHLWYGLSQFHISWLTLVLVRDEQFSGRKTVFNKSWYFSSDIPSLKMTFIMSANSSLTFLSTFSFSLKRMTSVYNNTKMPLSKLLLMLQKCWIS
jgi:hypothetical protein